MAYNKVTQYGDSENILDSEVGLVTKTVQADQSMADTIDGRQVIKAGTLCKHANYSYEAVYPGNGDNPMQNGWYEINDEGNFKPTSDTTPKKNIYYKLTADGSEMRGVVLYDHDITDYDEKPIAIAVAGRLKADRVSSDARDNADDLRMQGLYLV